MMPERQLSQYEEEALRKLEAMPFEDETETVNLPATVASGENVNWREIFQKEPPPPSGWRLGASAIGAIGELACMLLWIIAAMFLAYDAIRFWYHVLGLLGAAAAILLIPIAALINPIAEGIYTHVFDLTSYVLIFGGYVMAVIFGALKTWGNKAKWKV